MAETRADLQQLGFKALGTEWHIEAKLTEDNLGIPDEIVTYVRMFESAYSRFDSNSLLSHLNSEGFLENPPQQLLDMLGFAHQMYTATQGVFNISVGGTLQNLGYGQEGKGEQVVSDLWDTLVYNSEKVVLPRGAVLDFGGFGKGWLIDELGKLLQERGVEEFIINGGGDMLIHMPEPVEIALEHPLNPGVQIGTTRIQHGALAVSSNVKRAWKKGSEAHHHIVDPSTNASTTNDVVSTTVRAETALVADTCATVLLIDPKQQENLSDAFGLKAVILRREHLEGQ